MSNPLPEQALRDELRASSEPLDPVQVTARALALGVTSSRALRIAFDRFGQRGSSPGTGLAALVVFLDALAKASDAPVLEYSASNQWLSLETASSTTGSLTLVSPVPEMIEALRTAQPQAKRVLWRLAEALPAQEIADQGLVICAPPLGGTRGAEGDRYGGEVFRSLLPKVAAGGRAIWLTARGVLIKRHALDIHENLAAAGWSIEAILDVPPGALPDSGLETVLLCYRKAQLQQRLVGVLRNEVSATDIAATLCAGPVGKSGDSWLWRPASEWKFYREIAQERLIGGLRPKGRSTPTTLRDLLSGEPIVKADRAEHSGGAAIYIPEYAGSRVSARLEDQTVKHNAVHRVPIDDKRVSAPFLAHLLNTPYGREIRWAVGSGVTVKRASVDSLLDLPLPVPDRHEQERIVRSLDDLSLLRSQLAELGDKLSSDWSEMEATEERIDRLLGVLDLERQIADWWLELPYPLATVYRRFRTRRAPKDRLEALFHFFELTAIYVSIAAISHLKAISSEVPDTLAPLLWPAGRAGLDRPDFGFWTTLASTGLKNLRRIESDPASRAAATAHAGPEALQSALALVTLSPAIEALESARDYRNRHRGHGGHMKPRDAEQILSTLEPLVRQLYEHGARTLRGLMLVRTGSVEMSNEGMRYAFQTLAGSDPTFSTETALIDTSINSHILAFWRAGSRWMCPVLPLMRIGAPDRPEDNTCYVFNRTERNSVRWVSYQEAAEQEFIEINAEIQTILALKQVANRSNSESIP